MYIYRRFEDQGALALLLLTWRFIDDTLIDHEHGEWFERVRRDGSKLPQKGDEWKSVYHNGRALLGCVEMLRSGDE